MKKNLIILILTFLVFGCSDIFEERYPNTSLMTESFYSTTKDAAQALTSVYNMAVREDFWSLHILSEVASDNCAGGAGQSDAGNLYQHVDRALQAVGATAHQDPWKVNWGGVYRANIYIQNENLVDWTGKEALQKQYLGEVRFLRAYYHFYLSRMFGNMPAVDHPLSPGELPGRTEPEELYTFMLDDLKYAAENCLSAKYGNLDPNNWGRVTKWAAEAMFARVYLFYSGYYNDETCTDYTAETARDYIDDVINNSGHDLVDQYASLWRVSSVSELGAGSYAGEINPEVLWSIRYEASGNIYQWFSRMIGPRNYNVDPYGQGWGGAPVLPALWNLYDNADTRKTATILSWVDEGLTYNWQTEIQAQYTGYNCKKYDIESSGNTPVPSSWQQEWDEDYIIIRFADVLLMGAELHLLTGDGGTATTLTNKVRERAFGDNTHNYGSVTIDDIMLERRLELACEGQRYWDILRMCKGDFSKLVTILTYNDETDGGNFSQTPDAISLDVDGNNFAKTKGLFQIPQAELDLMGGSIEQNPGFE